MRNAAPVVMCALLAACAGDPNPSEECLSSDQADVLARHVSDLTSQIGLAAGHQDAQNAVGFVSVPGQAETMVNYYTLFMPCTGPSVFDPYCDGATCSQIECNGDPSWTLHSWLDGAPVEADGWTFAEAKTDVTWPGAGDVLEIALLGDVADADGADWSFTGTVSYEDGAYELEETYPDLVAGGTTTLELQMDLHASTSTGTLKVGGNAVADLSGAPTILSSPIDLCP